MLWFESGYFDTSSENKPLLHLWSLGIEEQFYLIWPLLILLAFKLRLNLLTVSLALLLVSFVLNIKGIKHDSVATFFSPQTRFWELLFGSTLAWFYLYKPRWVISFISIINRYTNVCLFKTETAYRKGTFSNMSSFVGICLITYGLYHLKPTSIFPGANALIPVLGAFLLIASGPEAWINKYILSNRLVVWFGLISYPLYLWHWPLLSVSRIVTGESPSIKLGAVLVLTSILLAWLTYRYIEPIFRKGRNGNVKAVCLLMVLCVIGGMGYFIYEKNGLPQRLYSQKSIAQDQALQQIVNNSRDNCNRIFPEWRTKNDNFCAMYNPHGNNTVALIGDSFSDHLFPGLLDYADRLGGVEVFPASCAAPFINVKVATRVKDERMRLYRESGVELHKKAFDNLQANSTNKLVVLVHNPECSWGDAIDLENPNERDTGKVLAAGLDRTLKLLEKAKKKVVIVLSNPLLPFDPQKCTLRPVNLAIINSCSYSRAKFESDRAWKRYAEIVRTIATRYKNVSIFDASSLFCDKATCYLEAGGKLLYRDRGHLNYNGSRLVAPELVKELQRRLAE